MSTADKIRNDVTVNFIGSKQHMQSLYRIPTEKFLQPAPTVPSRYLSVT